MAFIMDVLIEIARVYIFKAEYKVATLEIFLFSFKIKVIEQHDIFMPDVATYLQHV